MRAGAGRRGAAGQGIVVGLLALVLGTTAVAEAPLPGPAVEAVAGLAADLAQRGFIDEAAEALDVLDLLGVPREAGERARKALAKRGAGDARPKGRPDVSAIRRAAAALADAAAAAPEGPLRRTIAEQSLRLSGGNEKAHKILGHVLVEGRWMPSGDAGVAARRRAILEAAARARTLEVPVAVGVIGLADLLRQVKKARRVSGPDVVVESAWLTTEEMARAVRTATQVNAFSWWTHSGTLKAPTERAPLTLLLFSKVAQYEAWVEERVAAGGISQHERDFARSLTSWASAGVIGMRPETGATAARTLIWHLWRRHVMDETGVKPTACLAVGHVNWASLLVAGLPLTRLASLREITTEASRTSDDPGAGRRLRIEREAAAGLLGTRAWLRERARRGTDPPWRQSFVGDPARIGGEDLLKSTSLAEHLVETGRFWDTAREAGWAPEDLEAGFAEALGAPVAAIEARWRDWLLADMDAGLAERVERLGDDPETSGAGWIARLDEHRRTARLGGWEDPAYLPLRMDPDLCAGCRAHARYLLANPDVAGKWPDMHEERSERPSFSPEGARAGGASVIYMGVGSVSEAVDGWMATFYHRVPLLDPGLVRLGVAREKSVAVLDVQSMVTRPVSGTVVWPPPDGTGVPRRFASGELPHPVPGESQTAWGYPITVQVYPDDGEPIDVGIVLRRGGPTGAVIEGHLLTPSRHAQPAFHPPRTSCFIPKAPLDAGTLYHVHTSGYYGGATYHWTFTTGKR